MLTHYREHWPIKSILILVISEPHRVLLKYRIIHFYLSCTFPFLLICP